MHSPHHQQPCALEYIPDSSGLEEFDAESGESRLPSPPARALPRTEEVRVFSVIEQYEPCDGPWLSDVDTALLAGTRPRVRLLVRLAIAVVLVAIPSGTPVGTEGLPVPSAAQSVHLVGTAQVPRPAVTPAPVAAEPEGVRKRAPRPSADLPPPRAGTETASAVELASLRKAFASLDGPFMTFEHCEVRLASADRAVARCQGTRREADSGDGSPRQRHVEWTLDFDPAEQRWLIVDAAAR